MKTVRYPFGGLFLLVTLTCLLAWWAGVHLGWNPRDAQIEQAGRMQLAIVDGLEDADLLTAFPPLVQALSLGAYGLSVSHGDGILALLSSIILAGLIAGFHGEMSRQGLLGRAARAVVIGGLLLGSAGLVARGLDVSKVLLVAGTALLCFSAFRLHQADRIDHLITASLMLPLLALSSEFGLALALVAWPLLGLNLPRERLRLSFTWSFMTLGFPLMLGLSSYGFVNWLLQSDPLQFTHTWRYARPNLTDELMGLWPVWSNADGVMGLRLLLVGAMGATPLALLLAPRAPSAQRLAAACLMAWLVAGWIVAEAFGLVLDGAWLACVALPMAAVAMVQQSAHEVGSPAVHRVAVAGFAACGVAVVIMGWSPSPIRDPRLAATGSILEPAVVLAQARTLGAELRGREDVLFDAGTVPSVIGHRGHALGISAGASPLFKVTLLTRDLASRWVVVRNPQSEFGPDLIGRTFPELYAQGHPGYRLRHDGALWRVYERSDSPLTSERSTP